MPHTVVLLIDDLHEWTGTEVHLIRLLKRLDRHRIRPVVAVVGRADLAPPFMAEGIDVVPLQIHRVFAPSGAAGVVRIARLLQREHTSLLITYHTTSDLMSPITARLVQHPILSCQHDENFTKKRLHINVQHPLNHLLTNMISISHTITRTIHRNKKFPLHHNQIM